MPAFKEYKEAKSQLPLFKISVNSNQPLSAQLNEYDKKKSVLRAVLNTRSKRDNNLVHYDDLTMAQKMNTTALSMSRLCDRMLNCPVAVISGYRTYNDKAIIADYGLKEATKILELNATTEGEKKEEVEALLKPFMLTNADNEKRTKWLRKKLDLYKGYIGYKIVKGYTEKQVCHKLT
ncbi:hypothetical protein JT203_06255 [Helicobacter pylori]|uniref:hypothetical protein n=1 Tax=Helicobacter pylori TaxID=210 RepID=UPI00041F9EAC|nr:hypothetical protein [Helicobacter pylori]MCQ2939348.1 hypothetical protein [Helicobacter pylori]MDU9805963.1 hypothetical protein [Helicobacter pylori]WQR79968.1 hypothetical protein KVC50_04790 [Helicobacter pylori]WRA76095.1 hypothetical protein FE345_04695 [Helicobacter pylori]